MEKIKPWTYNDAVESAVLLALLRIEQKHEATKSNTFPVARWAHYEKVWSYFFDRYVVSGDCGERQQVTSHDVNLALKRLARRGTIARMVAWRGCYGVAKYALNE